GSKLGAPRLLIVGCGDVSMRLLPLLRTRFRVFATTSQPARCAELRAAGAIPLVVDLDRPATLARIGRLATCVVHLAPPQADGTTDLRTRHLAAIQPDRASMVYANITGVCGDCSGDRLDETRLVRPRTARA